LVVADEVYIADFDIVVLDIEVHNVVGLDYELDNIGIADSNYYYLNQFEVIC
jgi:hypothetical protein